MKHFADFMGIFNNIITHLTLRNYFQTPSPIAIETFRRFDPILTSIFSDKTFEMEKKYDFLFSYFITGFLLYRGNSFSLVFYPGAPSQYGPPIDSMEGFTRMLPIICSWLSSGREKIIETLNGRKVDLEKIVKDGLMAGTDPDSPGYWGDISDRDQRICEAADLALSIWLVRDSIWLDIRIDQRKKIIDWLLCVNGKKVWDNNWHLFPVMINEVTAALGYEQDAAGVQAHYSRFKSFNKGDGWFSDGPKNVYDYYNAWAMYYTLFWVDRVNPEFDQDFIRESLRKFLKYYVYLLSPQGIPILGRSICYRMAASVPLIAGHIQDPALVDAGLAQRGLDSLWSYFISNGAVAQGNVTQGYYKKELRFLDNYSGPGSCLWTLRSLVLAFFCKEDSPIWTEDSGRLPVEIADYCITIPSIGWTVTGFKETQEIIIDTGKPGRNHGGIENYTVFHKIAGFIARRPFRPKNDFVKYQLARYSSKEPFCGCTQ